MVRKNVCSRGRYVYYVRWYGLADGSQKLSTVPLKVWKDPTQRGFQKYSLLQNGGTWPAHRRYWWGETKSVHELEEMDSSQVVRREAPFFKWGNLPGRVASFEQYGSGSWSSECLNVQLLGK